MTRLRVDEIVARLLRERGSVSARELAEAAGFSRQAAHYQLRKRVELGELVREGAARATRYRPPRVADDGPPGGPLELERSYPRAEVTEDLAWQDARSTRTVAALSETATDIAHYAVTEIVNNAVDHSGGSRVTMTVSEARGEAVVTVDDDGVGIFDHVRERLGLPSRLDALLELHKGKTTTMPDRHSGEGLFFVSKAVRWLEITSGGLRWIVDNGRDDMAIHEAPPRVGTRVAFAVPHAPRRPLRAVFDEYTDGFEFSRTRATVRLFDFGEKFVSRSEAKRLMHGMEKFREVILDFDRVTGIGQGFADEVFRVWAAAHPDTTVTWVHACEPVEFMAQRARHAAR